MNGRYYPAYPIKSWSIVNSETVSGKLKIVGINRMTERDSNAEYSLEGICRSGYV